MLMWECAVCGEEEIPDYVEKCPFCDIPKGDNVFMCEVIEVDEEGNVTPPAVSEYTDDLMLNVGIAVYEREGGYRPVFYNYVYPGNYETVHELPIEGSFREAAKKACQVLIEFIRSVDSEL